jgi:hypothetical protein
LAFRRLAVTLVRTGEFQGAFFDNCVYLPLLHTLVEERAGVRRFVR